MFTEALFTRTKTGKPPKCPSISEWIKKLWNLYTMEYYSVIKKDDNTIFSNIDNLEMIPKWSTSETTII